MKFTVVLSADPESGVVTATCPAMPGAVSQCDSRALALVNIAEAMEGWLVTARENGSGPHEESAELIADEIAFILGYRREDGWDLVVEAAVVEMNVAAAA